MTGTQVQNGIRTLSWNQILVIALALMVPFGLKVFLSYHFFGSTDLPNFRNAAIAVEQGQFPLMNYFPPYLAIVDLARWMAVNLDLPFAFTFKFQSVILELILSIFLLSYFMQKKSLNSAILISVLFQMSPINIMISTIHGQMEAHAIVLIGMSVLLFAGSVTSAALAGFALGLAFGIKVFPLFLLPLYLLVRNVELKKKFAFVIGFTICFFLFSWKFVELNFTSIKSYVSYALSYKSYPIFGSYHVFEYFIQKFSWNPEFIQQYFFSNIRYFIVLTVMLIAAMGYFKRLNLQTQIYLCLLGVLTVSFNLAPQYLYWPIFLFFLLNRTFAGLLFQLSYGLFLIPYYYNYGAENSGSYAASDWAVFLEPVRALFGSNELNSFLLYSHGRFWSWFILLFIFIFELVRLGKIGSPKDITAAISTDCRPEVQWLRRISIGSLALFLIGFLWVVNRPANLEGQPSLKMHIPDYLFHGHKTSYSLSLNEEQAERGGEISFLGNSYFLIYEGESHPTIHVGKQFNFYHGGNTHYREGNQTVNASNGPKRIKLVDNRISVRRAEVPPPVFIPYSREASPQEPIPFLTESTVSSPSPSPSLSVLELLAIIFVIQGAGMFGSYFVQKFELKRIAPN